MFQVLIVDVNQPVMVVPGTRPSPPPSPPSRLIDIQLTLRLNRTSLPVTPLGEQLLDETPNQFQLAVRPSVCSALYLHFWDEIR